MLRNEEIANLAGSPCLSWWHALYTRHQHENVVAQALSGKGFEVFLPQYRTVHRWRDRQKELLLPLFPNYVFIHGGLDRMLNIVTTPGVHSLISWGGRPADIPSEEIEAVRRLVESPLQVEPHPFLKCGDLVRIRSGPLEGIEGIPGRAKEGLPGDASGSAAGQGCGSPSRRRNCGSNWVRLRRAVGSREERHGTNRRGLGGKDREPAGF